MRIRQVNPRLNARPRGAGKNEDNPIAASAMMKESKRTGTGEREVDHTRLLKFAKKVPRAAPPLGRHGATSSFI